VRGDEQPHGRPHLGPAGGRRRRPQPAALPGHLYLGTLYLGTLYLGTLYLGTMAHTRRQHLRARVRSLYGFAWTARGRLSMPEVAG